MRDDLAVRKKDIESKIAKVEKIKKIMSWVQGTKDPEPSLDFIREMVSPSKRYKDTAQWFFDSADYKCWENSLLDINAEQAPKRALWLCGPYGTGKTTIRFVSVPLTRVL